MTHNKNNSNNRTRKRKEKKVETWEMIGLNVTKKQNLFSTPDLFAFCWWSLPIFFVCRHRQQLKSIFGFFCPKFEMQFLMKGGATLLNLKTNKWMNGLPLILRISVTRWLDYFFNIWLFTTLKICPIALQICQNKLIILPNTKLTLSKWPKWQNFTKSDHTAQNVTLVNFAVSGLSCFFK